MADPLTIDNWVGRVVAIERGEAPADLIIKVTGRNSLTDTTTLREYDYECVDIAKVECLVCGTQTSDPGSIDLWNGYGDCPGVVGIGAFAAHEEQRHLSRWTYKTGRIIVIARREDGGPEFIVDTDPDA